MMYLGDYPLNGIVYFCFNTQKLDGTPITLAGTPTVDVRKNNTAAPLTFDTPPVVTADFNGITGLNNVVINLNDADAITGDYSVAIKAGTVNTVSVIGRVVAQFSIQNRYNDVNIKTITANAISATAINDGAITAAKIADAAIDNATFAPDVGSTDYATNIIALAVRKVLDELNLDHLAKIVTTSADMTTEIVDATILSRIIGNGDTSTFVPSTDGLHAANVNVDTIKAKTDHLSFVAGVDEQDIKATLNSGNVAITSIGNDVITAASLDEDAITAISAAVLNELPSDYSAVANSLGQLIYELQQRHNGKVVVDRSLGTIKVYNTSDALMFTLSMITEGDIDTLTRT